MKQKKFGNNNIFKNALHWVLCSSGALLLMSFSASRNRSLPMPGKDKIAKPIDPKEGKKFVSLLPTTRPVTMNTARKANESATVKVALNSNVRSFADNYIHYEKTDLTKMKVWAQPIFKLMDAILIRYNLPTQLKYVAVIESALNRNMRMKSGPTGPWQLTREEGIRYGLIKNGNDYRTDYAKSTEAAAKIFTSLYNRYDDWLLALAAYNAGEGRVNRAIAASGSRDFWKMQGYLPLETRNYIKKYISTHYFFEGSGGITTIGADETKKYKQQSAQNIAKNTDADTLSAATDDSDNVIRLQGMYSKDAVCKALDMDLNEFDKLNPNFDQTLSGGQFYDMHLPNGKTEEFEKEKNEILQQSFNQLLDDANNAMKDK